MPKKSILEWKYYFRLKVKVKMSAQKYVWPELMWLRGAIGSCTSRPCIQNCFVFYGFSRIAGAMWERVSKVSKQELYFAKENYEIFSTEVSAREKQEQNKDGPHQGFIGSLVVSSVGRPFWICSPVGEILSRNVPCRCLFIVQFLILPSSCEVSWKNNLWKPLVNAELLASVIKRRSANHSWRPSLKAAPKKRMP